MTTGKLANQTLDAQKIASATWIMDAYLKSKLAASADNILLIVNDLLNAESDSELSSLLKKTTAKLSSITSNLT